MAGRCEARSREPSCGSDSRWAIVPHAQVAGNVLARNVRELKTMGIIAWLVVGAIAGWLAGLLVKGDEGMGVIGHIVLGIVGALVGGFVAGLITGGDYISGVNLTTIIVATIGAGVVVVAWNALRGTPRLGR